MVSGDGDKGRQICENLMIEYGMTASDVLALLRKSIRAYITPDIALLFSRADIAIRAGQNEYLQMNAFAVISDSGTLPEESSFYLSIGKPFPAVCIRTSTERPEALDKGCFVLAGIDENGLLQAVETAVELASDKNSAIPVPDYTDKNVSDKIVRLIQSYTGIVNKMVWRKF